ncbi:hypothetical protein [Stenotrophomonas sp. Iso1]|uniref:hypothetical protein n=1 Tax=Stenotrophomonas sp. Iso1 TaxID=2977283 RepID=UPI0022B77213|nr:hypothetical protein [Stenotrophomonas sp. Iso1]
MDMLLYLGVLPVGISSAGFMVKGLARQGLDKALEKRDVRAAESSSTVISEDHVMAAVPGVLLAGHINLGIGLDARELLAASAAPPRPALSTRFRDAQSLPIRVSAAEQLDELEVIGEREQGIDTGVLERRALALLSPVLDELLAAVAVVLPPLKSRDEIVVAGLRRSDEGHIDNVLTIELLVASNWSDALLHWLRDWLAQRAIETGIDARRFDVSIKVMGDAAEVWQHVSQLNEVLATNAVRWHLLLACDSSIDPNVINAWQANGLLATSRNPDGKVPGEGAAGVLLASPGLAREKCGLLWGPHSLTDEALRSARPAERRRQLAAAATQWTHALAFDGQSIQFVLHDAGQGSEEIVDAALVATAMNPDFEFGTGSLSLAACAGELGPVFPVAQLALALEQIQRKSESVLVLAGAKAQQQVLTLVSAGSSNQAASLSSIT